MIRAQETGARKWRKYRRRLGIAASAIGTELSDLPTSTYPASRAVPTDPNRAWQHPWLRVSLLNRMMLGTRWDAETWPQVKTGVQEGSRATESD